MYKTFKKGQRVKLKKFSEELQKYESNPGIVPEMFDYFGKYVTIKRCGDWTSISSYYIEEDTANYLYDVR